MTCANLPTVSRTRYVRVALFFTRGIASIRACRLMKQIKKIVVRRFENFLGYLNTPQITSTEFYSTCIWSSSQKSKFRRNMLLSSLLKTGKMSITEYTVVVSSRFVCTITVRIVMEWHLEIVLYIIQINHFNEAMKIWIPLYKVRNFL